MATPNTDKLVSAYIKLRNAITDKTEEIKDLKEKQQRISDALLTTFAEQGTESMRTESGTVSRRIQTRFWASDWHEMHEFMKENDALHLLESRIHTGNMQKFLEDNPDKLPKGLQSDRKYIVSVTKPRSK